MEPALPEVKIVMDNKVAVGLGDMLAIERYTDYTTGFSWEITLSPGLYLISEKFHPPDKVRWLIKTINPGAQVITLLYRRIWEPRTRAPNYIDVEVKTETLYILLHRGKVSGYHYRSRYHYANGQLWLDGEVVSDSFIKLSGKSFAGNQLRLYRQQDQRYYSLLSLSNRDSYLHLYTQEGEWVGCPTGGPTGKGDGTKWPTELEREGEIIILSSK